MVVSSSMATELKDFLNSNSSDSTDASISTSESIEEMEKMYAAYVRKDAYGTMGRGDLPLTEKLLLGVATITLVPIRLVIGILILLVYYLICRFCTLFKNPNGENEQEDYAHMLGWRREVVIRCGRFLSRVMLFNFGFYWIKETRKDSSIENDCKERHSESERPGVIVSNHVSYLDILYHMSSFFPSFVAKRSVGKLPMIGLISKCLGCVFVQRELKSSEFKGVSGVISERIQAAYQNKHCPMMLIFPEGTTTNGDYLLPFKTGAFLAKVPVLPMILRYPYKGFSPAWDTISGEEKDDPKLYASNIRRLMAAEGNLVLSEIGLPEKRVYHAALNGKSQQPRVLHPKDA